MLELLKAVLSYPINAPVLFLNYHWMVDCHEFSSRGAITKILFRWLIVFALVSGSVWYSYYQDSVLVKNIQKENQKLIKEKDERIRILKLEQDKSQEELSRLVSTEQKHESDCESLRVECATNKIKLAKAVDLIFSFEKLLNENKTRIKLDTDLFKKTQALDKEFIQLQRH